MQRGDRTGALAINELRHRADFQIPISAVDALELAHFFNQIQPLSDVVVGSRQISFVDLVGLLRGNQFSFLPSAAVLHDKVKDRANRIQVYSFC